MLEMKEWDGFEGRLWKEEINVRQFIQDNYTPYDGNEDFLAGPTEATNKLWGALQKLQKQERAKGGVLDMETEVVTGITAYGPGYIDESLKALISIIWSVVFLDKIADIDLFLPDFTAKSIPCSVAVKFSRSCHRHCLDPPYLMNLTSG